MAMIKKKAMGKPMTKAKNGTQTAKPKKVVKKSPPPYEDDMNDRLMADTYTKYMLDKKAGKIPLEPTIQRDIKSGKLNPDGTEKIGTQRGTESNMSRTPMKKGGMIKKAANGASLKPVPAGKKGLAKLPTPVRNKMGFQKNGGKVKK